VSQWWAYAITDYRLEKQASIREWEEYSCHWHCVHCCGLPQLTHVALVTSPAGALGHTVTYCKAVSFLLFWLPLFLGCRGQSSREMQTLLLGRRRRNLPLSWQDRKHLTWRQQCGHLLYLLSLDPSWSPTVSFGQINMAISAAFFAADITSQPAVGVCCVRAGYEHGPTSCLV
jgi:hypothetical protein